MEAIQLSNTTPEELLTQLNIASIKDKSDAYIQRLRIYFKNNYQLSVIKGRNTYGGNQGLFEIAIFDPAGDYSPELFEGTDTEDDVLGHQSAQQVQHYIEKVGSQKSI